HHLDEEDALMGPGRVADAVYRLDRAVCGGIEPDTVVGSVNVVIDAPRHTDECCRVRLGRKQACTVKRPLPSDQDDAVETHLLDGRCRFKPPVLCVKLA